MYRFNNQFLELGSIQGNLFTGGEKYNTPLKLRQRSLKSDF